MGKNRNNITTAVSDEVMDALDLLAQEAGKTRAAYARRVYEDHVRAKSQTPRDRVEAAFPDPPVRPMKVSRGIPASVVLPSADDDHQYERDDDLPDNVHICWCGVAKHEHHKPANELL